jgi:hypothetical protein
VSFCRINGIVVPVDVDDSPDEDPQLIEDAARMEDASLYVDRRAEKGRWSINVILQNPTYAPVWRKLFHGDGQYWPFDTSLYSSKGLGPSGSTGSNVIGSSSPSPWLGAGRLGQTATSTISFAALTSSSPWTAQFARNVNAAGWNNYLINSLGQKWINGGRDDGLSTTFFGVAAGVVTLTADAALATAWDELVVYPFVMPTDWPPQMHNWAIASQQIGSLRAVKLDGDLVDDATVRSVIARVTGTKIRHAKVSGVKTAMRKLGVELEEV